MANSLSTEWISPPGETIEDLLEEHGWSKAELAERLDCTPKHVNELLKGRATINAETAAALSRVLGSTTEFWLEREARYRAALQRQGATEALAKEKGWLKELPIRWMEKERLIPELSDVGERVEACLRYFGIADVAAWRKVYLEPHAAYRSSQKFCKQPGAVATWHRRAEIAAEEVLCAKWNERGFKALLPELRSLTLEEDPSVFVPQLQERCANHGVAVVFVPTPPGCPVSGATWWLNPNKAVLALSLRHKTNDHLWFAFFHEAAHLLLHSKKMAFLEGMDGLDSKLEQEANDYAGRILIPAKFEAELSTLLSPGDVKDFAERVGIHPGIVVGRLHHDELLGWGVMADLKIRYTWMHDAA